jgi:cytochrome c-type biogenesis protein CcmH
MRRALTALTLAVLATALGLPAKAQPVRPVEVPPEAVAAIARDLNCPLCQGYNLQDCPLTVCAQMRDQIRERLAAGATRETIIAGFVADFGPQVLNTPPTEGFFLAAWVLPALVLLAGAGIVLGVVRRGRRPVAAADLPPPEPVAVDPATAQRLENLLRDEEVAP